jgi:hypothetical protein
MIVDAPGPSALAVSRPDGDAMSGETQLKPFFLADEANFTTTCVPPLNQFPTSSRPTGSEHGPAERPLGAAVLAVAALGRVLINRRRCPLPSDPDRPCATAAVAMGQKPTFIQINSGMRLQNQEFDNLSAVCHEHEIDQLNGMF